jgi:hypothetical protein
MSRGNRRSERRTFKGRTLDVSLRADPRNGNFPVSALFSASVEIPLQSQFWGVPLDHRLDQGAEGSCVGFAGAHCYGAEPLWQKITRRLARKFYKGAQKFDEWPGENYSGTSVNGLMAFLKLKKWCGEYRWLYSLEELKRTISFHGPVIVGSQWRQGCFEPDISDFIHFEGTVKGGHATCWTGVNIDLEYFVIQQSWGRDHGNNGQVKISFADAEKLIRTRPQICFPDKRSMTSISAPTKAWWKFWK